LLLATTVQIQAGGKITGQHHEFEKCKGYFSQGKDPDLCFKTKLDKIIVDIGKQGTNDDVFIEICNGFDQSNCCKTPAMSSWADDWSKNDHEEWGKKYFGNCSEVVYKVKHGLTLKLSKNNPAKGLKIKGIEIKTKTDAKGKNLKKKPYGFEDSFTCGAFTLGNGKGDMTNTCLNNRYSYMRINGMEVQMGPDGTDDNVEVKVCSDMEDVCCAAKLTGSMFSDDWHRGSLEKWQAKHFGTCGSDIMYKISENGAPSITVSKDGTDTLKVVNLKFSMKTQDKLKTKFHYDCGGFEFLTKCNTGTGCHKTLSCRATTASSGTTRSRSSSSSRRGASGLRNALGGGSRTTRAPFRSVSG